MSQPEQSNSIELFRRSTYGEFRACDLPITNCKYIEVSGNAWHASCNKQQYNQDSGDKPVDHLICELCKKLAKVSTKVTVLTQAKNMKCIWGSRKRNKRQIHQVGEVGQSSGVDNSTSSENLPGATTDEASAVPSMPCQQASSSSAVYEDEVIHETAGVASASGMVDEATNHTANQAVSEIAIESNDVSQVTNQTANQNLSPPQNVDKDQEGMNTTGPPLQIDPKEIGTMSNSDTNSIEPQASYLASSSSVNSLTNVDGYFLRGELTDIFKAITVKYGDISRNCTIGSKIFRSSYLETICLIVKTLQITPVKDLSEYQLFEMLESLADMRKVGFDMEWLNIHLVKVKKIMELSKAYQALQFTRDQQQQIADLLKKSIALKEEELSNLTSQFAEARAKYDKIYHEIMVIKSGLEEDHKNTLVDGLL
ncbi:unnamed protein product [Ilex paraguariensis]|uniref:Uncharacterized protein n=1 Tax=Ilex paraguariensis TaxID=185542 RepID=A0ABC8S9W7_9AQUA